MLVKNAYEAYCLKLPVTATDCLEEQEEIKKKFKEKIISENGLFALPDPVTLQDEQCSAQTLFMMLLLTISIKMMLEKYTDVERVFRVLNICQMR